MKKNHVIKFDSKERILKTVRSYVESVETFFDVSMTIRDATEDDLPAIVAIYNASVPGRTATADTEAASIDSRRDWFRDHDPEKRPLWVAVDNEVVVGWLSFQSFYGRPAYHATAEISVYVTRRCSEKASGGN